MSDMYQAGSDYQDDGDSDVAESTAGRRALRSQRPARNARDRNDKRRRRDMVCALQIDSSSSVLPLNLTIFLFRYRVLMTKAKQLQTMPSQSVLHHLHPHQRHP